METHTTPPLTITIMTSWATAAMWCLSPAKTPPWPTSRSMPTTQTDTTDLFPGWRLCTCTYTCRRFPSCGAAPYRWDRSSTQIVDPSSEYRGWCRLDWPGSSPLSQHLKNLWRGKWWSPDECFITRNLTMNCHVCCVAEWDQCQPADHSSQRCLCVQVW